MCYSRSINASMKRENKARNVKVHVQTNLSASQMSLYGTGDGMNPWEDKALLWKHSIEQSEVKYKATYIVF